MCHSKLVLGTTLVELFLYQLGLLGFFQFRCFFFNPSPTCLVSAIEDKRYKADIFRLLLFPALNNQMNRRKHFCFAKYLRFCKKLGAFFLILFPFSFFHSSFPRWNFHSPPENHGIVFLPGSELLSYLYGWKPSKLYKLFINFFSTPSFF